MTTAFQSNAFQNNAFQIDVSATTPDVVGGSSRGKGRKHRRIQVEIGDEIFEVATEQEGYELLLRARELAQQTAQEAAARAATKAARKDKPAAVERAFAIPAPKVRLLNADYADPDIQQLQARVDAAQAEIDATYTRILIAARLHFERQRADEDDEDVLMMMLHL